MRRLRNRTASCCRLSFALRPAFCISGVRLRSTSAVSAARLPPPNSDVPPWRAGNQASRCGRNGRPQGSPQRTAPPRSVDLSAPPQPRDGPSPKNSQQIDRRQGSKTISCPLQLCNRVAPSRVASSQIRPWALVYKANISKSNAMQNKNRGTGLLDALRLERARMITSTGR